MRIKIYNQTLDESVELTSDDYFQFSEGMKMKMDYDPKTKYIVDSVVYVLVKPNRQSDLGSLEQRVRIKQYDEKEETDNNT